MTRRTQLVSMLGLGSALLLSSTVYAQTGRPGGPGGAPGAAPAPGAPAAETGAVTNETSTTTTTTTDINSGGVLTDDANTLPNTGGAPWLMALAGSATAGSALLLRRKLS